MNSRRRFILNGTTGIAALAAAPMVNAAAAVLPQPSRSGQPVSLAYEPQSRTLLKASGTAMQSHENGGGWKPLELPAAAGVTTGVTSVSVAAGGKGVVYLAGPGVGVLRSEPGVGRFSPRNKGLPSKHVTAVTAHADQPGTVFAYIARRGIFRSEDGGLHWRLMDAGPRGGIVQFVHTNMPGSMQSGWLFTAGAHGVRRAMDCFCGWRDAGGVDRTIHAVAYEPQRPANLHAVSANGLLSSSDGGETWTAAAAPAAPVRALTATSGGFLYAASAGGEIFRRPVATGAWAPTGA